MKRYFTRNLEIKERLVRGFIAVVLILTVIVSFPFSVLLGLLLLIPGLFVLFEALRDGVRFQHVASERKFEAAWG